MDARAARLTPDVDLASLDWAVEADAARIVAEVSAAATTVETEADADASAEAVLGGLTEDQRAILDFERQWFRRAGAKEQAIRDLFGLSPTRYYQTLNSLLDAPEAHEYDAALVKRLLRLRAAALRSRPGR